MKRAALILAALAASVLPATPAEAAPRCSVSSYSTLFGARQVVTVRCPSRDVGYRVVVTCEWFGHHNRYGAWHWNNVASVASCTIPFWLHSYRIQWDR